MRRLLPILVLLAAAVLGAAPAQAIDTTIGSIDVATGETIAANGDGLAASTSATTYVGQDTTCLSDNQLNGTTQDCTVTGSGSVSAPVAASGALVTSLAATPGATYCQSWSQAMGGLSWREKHIGKMCYDYFHKQVWVWTAPGCSNCPTGNHYCNRGWAIGYSIDVTTCNVVKVYDANFRGGYFRQNWDRFQVHVVAKGIPAYRSYNMHVNIFSTGTVTFKY